MPELPEVETSKRGIYPYCLNQKIKTIEVRNSRLRWPVNEDISEKMSGQTIIEIVRRGKYLLLITESNSLMIHLGMSGSLRICEATRPVEKHDHVDIELQNGKIIRYNDPRRFGCVMLNPDKLNHKLLIKLGVEPLESEFSAEYLYKACKSSNQPIKSLIMNSQIVVGVGNIYAQESLFRSKIKPTRKANGLSRKMVADLVNSIKQILSQAIEAGGSSLKDFTSAEGKPGYFQQTLDVYGRSGQPCKQCGKELKKIIIAQRATVFCSSCQK
ncbi:MAG: bifunctional DNA-formamidopyrimidine glycosylase/DNA-(apurinic or apyrimidinic site) lyase [Gammaproteobacteria bacterium]|nr:bifunctional DNA-formamidopyrimidine glycosylase/DNA-(apurinic or apyrimidinic site) lyase [Gammaproteobacteria bacterium]MDH5629951.1 bifunctional DNA-formamidopyrimidine glycosylase/DNA-(apurinic or apyrimidinic site) lyase [Gammaproteobacteria bacterium]